jgi:hypothetical protein
MAKKKVARKEVKPVKPTLEPVMYMDQTKTTIFKWNCQVLRRRMQNLKFLTRVSA